MEVDRGTISVHHAFARAPGFDNAVTLAYATVGAPQYDAQGAVTNAVLLLHGTTGSGDQFLTGDTAIFERGGAFDHDEVYSIIPDALGHGRSSKASDGLGAQFPSYGYRDLVALQRRVLDHLYVQRPLAVVGTSMGGMHAWLWACEPNAADLCVAIACEPSPIIGRNLLWRRIIVDALADGARLRHVMPIFEIVSRGVGTLARDLPDRSSAEALVQRRWAAADREHEIDVMLEFDASFDYEPNLENLSVPVVAIAFGSDEVNPVSLSASKKVAEERPESVHYVLVADDEQSDGHQTLRQTNRWGPIVRQHLMPLHVIRRTGSSGS